MVPPKIASMADITEHKRTEEELRESEARYRCLVENARDAIFTIASDGSVGSLNPAFETITGWSRADWLSKPFGPIIHPEDLPLAMEVFRRVFLQGETPPLFELRLLSKSGNYVVGEFTITPQRQNDKVVSALGIARDITERKRTEQALRLTEEQLLQAQKMEAVGKLAGGVAHDFNNLLTIITGYSQLLLRNLGPSDPLRAEIEEIKKAGERAGSLTQQLLAFSRRQVLLPKVLDLNAVVGSMGGMLQRLLREDIHLVAALDHTLGPVRADPGQLEQVIMNLVVNARDAMPQGGKLTIETTNVEIKDMYHHGQVVVPGRYAMLAVSDNGCGMDAMTKSHLFEPFFTTKGLGMGTGLGLSTVYGIIRQSGGYVFAYSELGQGSTFKVYVPRVEDAIEALALGVPLPELPQGTETILLVEDEPGVRALVRDTLRLQGYTVLEARHGIEALMIGTQETGVIHLLLTDVVMPQMGGREVADRLLAARSDLRVLYMSGYTENAVVHRGVLNPGTAFLQKPFTPDLLVYKVREVLDAERG